ncbi:MAG: hypothetical protein PEGG_01618 [Paraeggerthella hongkongensis]
MVLTCDRMAKRFNRLRIRRDSCSLLRNEAKGRLQRPDSGAGARDAPLRCQNERVLRRFSALSGRPGCGRFATCQVRSLPLAIILIRGPAKLVRFDSGSGHDGECGRRATVRAAPTASVPAAQRLATVRATRDDGAASCPVVAAREKSRRPLRAPAPKEGFVDAAQARRPDDGGGGRGYSTPTITSVDFTMASASPPSASPSSSIASLVMEPLMREPSAVFNATWPLTAPFFTDAMVPGI